MLNRQINITTTSGLQLYVLISIMCHHQFHIIMLKIPILILSSTTSKKHKLNPTFYAFNHLSKTLIRVTIMNGITLKTHQITSWLSHFNIINSATNFLCSKFIVIFSRSSSLFHFQQIIMCVCSIQRKFVQGKKDVLAGRISFGGGWGAG